MTLQTEHIYALRVKANLVPHVNLAFVQTSGFMLVQLKQLKQEELSRV
jgi:hypothetical protein